MKRFAIVMLILACMAGCSTMNTQTTAVIQTIAYDAGYIGYRYVPDARAYLTGVCALESLADNATVTSMFVELVGAAWLQSSNLSGPDAQFAVLALNNLVGLLGVNDAVATTVPLADMKQAVSGLCSGVELASKQ